MIIDSFHTLFLSILNTLLKNHYNIFIVIETSVLPTTFYTNRLKAHQISIADLGFVSNILGNYCTTYPYLYFMSYLTMKFINEIMSIQGIRFVSIMLKVCLKRKQ